MKLFTFLLSLTLIFLSPMRSEASLSKSFNLSPASALMTNDVFFFITEGGPLAALDATVTISNADTSFTFITSDPFGGEVLSEVPFGTYALTITKTCYETFTDTVVVDENNGMGISVFADLQELTTNNVFFFITEGGPLAALDATVTISNADTSFTFVTSDPFGGELLENVPYGEYQLDITKTCYADFIDTITVDCNNEMGISVFADLQELTTNNVFFFITEGNPLAALDATVTISNSDTSFTFITSDPFGGELLENVPYGDYALMITKTCFEDYMGTVNVNCNDGMGISVFADLVPGGMNNVFFFITEGGPLAALDATVTLANSDTSFTFVTTDPFGGELLENVPAGDYVLTITKECYLDYIEDVNVFCDPDMGVSLFADLEEGAINDVFFFITEGGPLAALDVTVTLSNADTTITFVTSDPFGGEMLADVPGGTYNYSLAKDCYDTISGSLLVGCNDMMPISLFADLQDQTTNNVFFFITEGNPLAALDATVTISNSDTSFTFVTSDPFGGELIENVPFGDYDLMITKTCFEDFTGTVNVDCNDGMGVSVFADLVPGGENNVFFFITEGGPLAALDATVTIANADTSYSFVTTDPFGGELLENIPAGDYMLTITKECYLDYTEVVTVFCDPNMGVSIFADLEEGATNDVFFFITEGGPLAALDATVTLSKADTSFTFITSDPFGGEMLAAVPGGTYNYSITKDCYEGVSGSLLVGCNDMMPISLFADLQEKTTNNVFFFITEGGPLAALDATVTLSNADTSFMFITSDPFGGELLADVPYGDYSYSITKDCTTEVSGNLSVGCNDGMGISLFADLESSVNTNVIETGTTLTAEVADAVYQWVDCLNGFEAIAGETGQSFTALVSGSYAVMITIDGCTETSNCIEVMTVGVLTLNWPTEISLYPNPVFNAVTIEPGIILDHLAMRIVNASGQVVIENKYSGAERVELNIESLPAGVYMVQLIADDLTAIRRFVKN